MNLNRLYNIFGKRPPLSRKEIADYGKTKNPGTKHSIEMKEAADPFEADAMEGWESMNYDTSTMSNLDKRFLKTSNWGWYVTGTVVLAASVTGILLLQSPSDKINNEQDQAPEKITSLLEDQELIIDQTDIILPDSIEVLENAPMDHQIEVKTIQKDFKEMKTNYVNEQPPKVEMLPLDIRIEPKVIAPEIIREHNLASEIYLHDLKLVDYTKYRSKPTVRTKQVILTGTPANMEGEHSEDLTPEFKNVDIPYIEYLSKTMGRFSRKKYKNALTRFDVILNNYDDDVNANFYSGLCLYNLGQYSDAIERFIKCTSGPYSNFDEEAQWMTALCYEKLGQTNKAKSYFQKIIDQGGFYKNQAFSKMN